MNTSKIVISGDKVISPEQIDKLRTLGLHNKCRFPGYHRVNSNLVRAGGLKNGMMIAVSRTGEVEYYKKDTLMSLWKLRRNHARVGQKPRTLVYVSV